MMMCKILKEDRKGLIKNMEDENEIREKMIAIIREKARQCYSDRIVDYGTNPGNRGIIEDSDGYAEEKNECGGNIKMFLRVKGGKIEESRFVASGCIFTVAACNAATEMAKGKTIQDCLKINRRSIIAYLGGMPEDHAECAFLAALVFQRALRLYCYQQKNIGHLTFIEFAFTKMDRLYYITCVGRRSGGFHRRDMRGSSLQGKERI